MSSYLTPMLSKACCVYRSPGDLVKNKKPLSIRRSAAESLKICISSKLLGIAVMLLVRDSHFE